MLDVSRVLPRLEAARAFADALGLRAQLEGRLAYLDRYAAPRRTRCTLYPDFAPHSFAFTMEVETKDGEWRTWFEGGVVYHGPHDGHGSGVHPTLAVTLDATEGWSIHT